MQSYPIAELYNTDIYVMNKSLFYSQINMVYLYTLTVKSDILYNMQNTTILVFRFAVREKSLRFCYFRHIHMYLSLRICHSYLEFLCKIIIFAYTRGYQKVLSLTWKEPEIWIYSALFFNVVPFQLHTLVPSSFPVINTRSVEVNILVP